MVSGQLTVITGNAISVLTVPPASSYELFLTLSCHFDSDVLSPMSRPGCRALTLPLPESQ